jgi:plastocyanin
MARPLALAALVVLAGCGGDAGEPRRTVTVPAGQPANVSGREYRFDPSGLVVAAGKVRLRFSNEGSLAHDLRVFRGSRDLGGTPAFQHGTRTAQLDLPPGTYRMECTVGDHAELGMRGSLRVRARN